MKKSSILLITFLIAVCLIVNAEGFWRRRRRRRTTYCTYKWNACSRTCGGGTQSASRTSSADVCNLPKARSCNTHCCRVDCKWNNWSTWGTCSQTSGGGRTTRSRSYHVAASCGGTRCNGNRIDNKACNGQCCPVHCRVSGWSSFQSCSVTCGGGEQQRSRSITTPSYCGGNLCPSLLNERRSCNTGCCPVDCQMGLWGEFGSCSHSCGGGTRQRTRSIIVPDSCGGERCSEETEQIEVCNTDCCPVDCQYESWSTYSECSASCGGGGQFRTRGIAVSNSCNGEPCSESVLDSRSCNTDCCPVDCQWTEWSDHNTCSVTCGGGVRQRHRHVAVAARCSGTPCTGLDAEEEACNTDCCEVDCMMGEWSDFDSCSASCEGGLQTRSRNIMVQAECGGKGCNGTLMEQQACNEFCCPVDCEWTDWSEFGNCSEECGGGTKSRKRSISQIASCGGDTCRGFAADYVDCNTKECEVDCAWSEWKEWGECSATCGGGNQSRSREVATSAQFDGDPCEGPDTETRSCSDVCCPVDCEWDVWMNWTPCSNPCGDGESTRDREILKEESCDGTPCSGGSNQSRPCNDDECCPVDCEWEEWADWSSCSVTCGVGTQERNREVKQASSCGGEECVGFTNAIKVCNDQCCPVDCEVSDWSTWGECSATCGASGLRKRQRSVITYSSCNGEACPIDSDLTEDESCNQMCLNGGTLTDSSCSCSTGWSGDCCDEDVDECSLGETNCHLAAVCSNTIGGFECTCRSGFSGDGLECEDIDECMNTCTGASMTCENFPGSFECGCQGLLVLKGEECVEEIPDFG